MKYLVDTNVYLSVLLAEPNAPAVEIFLGSKPASHLCISVFSLDAIGVILYRRKKFSGFTGFVSDLKGSGVNLIGLNFSELLIVATDSQK